MPFTTSPTLAKSRFCLPIRQLGLASFVLGLAMGSNAQAGETAPTPSPFILSGYGTLGRAWDDHSRLVPIRDISERPDDNEHTGPTWLLDSRVGLQMAYRPDNRTEAVVQTILRNQEGNDLDSALELAYVGLLTNPDTKLRLGRVGPDVFLMSDHRNVGYAYPWIRPPREFYGWIPIYSVDGADIARDIHDGDALWRIKAQVGNSHLTLPMGTSSYDFETDYIWGLSLTRRADPWQFKLGIARFLIDSEAASLAPLHQGLDQVAATGVPGISAEAARLRHEASFAGAQVDYLTVGAAYDDGAWLGQAELSYTRASQTMATQGYAAYLAVGYRTGAWTPYAILSASRPRNDPLAPTGDWGAIGQNELRNIAYRVANSTRIDQESLALGVRWDFHDHAALKLQWDHSRIHPQGYTLWFRPMDILGNGERVNLLSLSLDFVF